MKQSHIRLARSVPALLGLAFCLHGTTVSADCAELRSYGHDDIRVIAATLITPAPTWDSPAAATNDNQPVPVAVPFCRVEAVIEKEIAFELWLPAKSRWNGRFLGIGNGGDAGFINYQDLARGVTRGFATVSTDTGHKRSEQRWALGHPDRVDNFTHRSHHLVATRVRALMTHFYSQDAKRAYFLGCSGGGSQGLVEAQHYPDDYDGIISGAAGIGMLPLSTRILATALHLEKNPQYGLSGAQWQMVSQAAIAQCDAADGIKDGVVDAPYTCKFDPARLQCTGASSDACLTKDQVVTVREAYSPLRDEQGAQIDPGFPPGVMYAPVPRQIGIAGLLFGDWTYQDPQWNIRGFSMARDVPPAAKKFPYLMFPQPDLRGFQASGGKLISYHGWLDEIVPPGLTVGFHESVVKSMGKAATADFFRLFMAPGMAHCSRGAGPTSFGQAFTGDAPVVDADHDLLTALMRWVEAGEAPDRIIAAHVTDGKVDRTRPLCPWPSRAHFKGSGSTDAASSFECR